MENGDIGAMNRVSSSRARPHDLDIKLLQAKRQQAEMRRLLFICNKNRNIFTKKKKYTGIEINEKMI